MPKAQKNRASKSAYISPRQLDLPGFESPFTQHLDPNNRWVKLAKQVPWDKIYSIYQLQLNNRNYGASGINPRVACGAIMIKHICDLSDRETILQIQENIYMQYFIGFPSFSKEPVFDPSLFVELRKRLGAVQINEITETIMGIAGSENSVVEKQESAPDKADESVITEIVKDTPLPNPNQPDDILPGDEILASDEVNPEQPKVPDPEVPSNEGTMMIDTTACPQDIAYPTDLNLINDAREKSEDLIDALYEFLKIQKANAKKKPRTYRKIARKDYLKIAQKKRKTHKEIRCGIRKQLGYLGRNIHHLHELLICFKHIPLNKHQYKYLLVIQTLYEQQKWMYDNKVHRVDDRIVSIHQPHVRPIVRGKATADVEFGAKIQVSIMNGMVFLEELSWDAFNEGTRLMGSIENYKRRFGNYPEKVFADKIYCNRENRSRLKALNIKLMAKPLGRPSAKAVDNHLRPGERNPIEGKFGQAKTAYGMNRIKARLNQTSESWIASIVLVLNLIKIIGQGLFCPIRNIILQQIIAVFILPILKTPSKMGIFPCRDLFSRP